MMKYNTIRYAEMNAEISKWGRRCKGGADFILGGLAGRWSTFEVAHIKSPGELLDLRPNTSQRKRL